MVAIPALPHAVELLSSGAGLVVDHDDPDATARALTTNVLTRPELAAKWQQKRPASRRAWVVRWSTADSSCHWPIASWRTGLAPV